MSYTQDQELRLGVDDLPKPAEEVLYGDGTGTAFQLAHYPLVSATPASAPSAYFYVTSAWSATGASFSYPFGRVSFPGIVSANSAVRIVYHWAIFSDEEICYFTGKHAGDLVSQKLLVVETLLMNAWKRHNWSAAGGQSVSEANVFDQLMKMRAMLQTKLTTELGPEGSLISWSEEQENYDPPYVG